MTPPTKNDAYKPIDCGFHDQLLAWATIRRPVTISHRNAAGQEVVVRGVIADVFSRGGAEYLRLAEGPTIRLDHLIRVTEWGSAT